MHILVAETAPTFHWVGQVILRKLFERVMEKMVMCERKGDGARELIMGLSCHGYSAFGQRKSFYRLRTSMYTTEQALMGAR